MGVSGAKVLAGALKENNTLQSINLYRNIIDVDGARALGETLKVNKTLKFIDIGHNRIRITGLKAIVDGIVANPDSKIKKLGIRANFINDDGFSELFEKLVYPAQGKHSLSHIFMEQNFLTEHKKIALHQEVQKKKANIYVDEFESVLFLEKELLDRSIWLAPLPKQCLNTESAILKFFSER